MPFPCSSLAHLSKKYGPIGDSCRPNVMNQFGKARTNRGHANRQYAAKSNKGPALNSAWISDRTGQAVSAKCRDNSTERSNHGDNTRYHQQSTVLPSLIGAANRPNTQMHLVECHDDCRLSYHCSIVANDMPQLVVVPAASFGTSPSILRIFFKVDNS
jgi:hypothetical protein